jgi:glycosyltransferase involved in cell wall biosynthesis
MVLFTGAMNRPENSSAVTWFIDEMWPRIIASVPSARFVVAGAKPPEALAAKVALTPRAELTGFVESLEPWYAEASVFVAPLRSGAGVKFKTIDAMLRGVPIVTTGVGAEGIEASELFGALTDDAHEFADSVIGVLQLPEAGRALAEKAQAWAEGVYGVAAFEKRVRGLYADVIDAR